MIPSVLARQLRQGVEDFLRTTFPISTPHFHGVVERLLAEDGGIFKGPYVSAQLPFRQATGDGEHFPEVPLGWRPFLHQEQAFRRLGGAAPRSTLVATGTGSGKTESFLVPIMDYCRRHKSEPGIKAVLIYPMNALANDQAGRIAAMVSANDGLRGSVRAGLYVGQRDEHPRREMTPDGIITDRDALRLDPPDILLTNYKMLDYLLVRPEDLPLWQHNGPETLRFMVVDELHTFDGAQGTDLACLIRRLKARLKTPARHLCCVGTSATLGGEEAGDALTTYAEQIFGESFDRDSVIGETRQSESEFLEGAYVQPYRPVSPKKVGVLDSARYENQESYLRGQVSAWTEGTGSSIEIGEFDDVEWRIGLGDFLKSHPLFRNLLTALRGKVRSLADLDAALTRATPELQGADEAYHAHLFDSLLALIAAARAPVEESPERREVREKEGHPRPTRPLVELRVQLWLRELRRMVVSVGAAPQLTFFDDLSEEQRQLHVPLIHCRDCGSTGWGAGRRALDSKLDTDLRRFYQGYFARHPNTAFLFPGEPEEDGDVEGLWFWLEPETLRLTEARQAENAIRVFLPDNRGTDEKGESYVHHDCPFCQGRDSLTILGSRAASLTSVLLTQLYASSFNEDKKLIAFSDSVQDASHRAGFFGARTYRFMVRSAIQQYIDRGPAANGEGEQPLTLAALPRAMAAHYRTLWSEERFVAAFLAPDMEWLQDYEALLEHGALPDDSNLVELVERRIEWEVLSEFGYRARIGRTLEKSGCAVPAVDPERLAVATARLLHLLPNELGGFAGLDDDTLRTFVLGMLNRLRVRGGVHETWLEGFIGTGGNTYLLNRLPHTPSLRPYSRLLSFLTRKGHPAFDALHSSRSTDARTWYEEWAEKCLAQINPMISSQLWEFYECVVPVLVASGLLVEHTSQEKPVWGVASDALLLRNTSRTLSCETCSHAISVPDDEIEPWRDAPCLRSRCPGRYREDESGGLDYYGALYRRGDLDRIIVREHTGLQPRGTRETLERNFIKRPHPWSPNLLSCTPTLEMGIDIGDLSTVLLCSIPPAQANYLQRIGRAGRRDGNALNVAVANGRPHDLYFYAQPEEMIAGQVDPPGVFLRAAAVLERQMTAYCLDRWVETGLPEGAIPSTMRRVLDSLDAKDEKGFPWNFLAFVEARDRELVDGFLQLFGDEVDEGARAYVMNFVMGGGENDRPPLDFKLVDGLRQLEKERAGLTKTVERLRRRVREMEKQEIRDKNFEEELGELRQERDALSRIIRENIDRRHTLNFLTDEGLIPNYAFPEAGIILRSVIYKKSKSGKDGEGEGGWDTTVFEYQRPAVSAITELAPSSRFYAEGRNVEIDRIDLAAADVETWRLCDNCSHSVLEFAEEAALAQCPRCGSSQWADAGQQHQMIRMRQVYAKTPDRRSRTGDDSDDRRPSFFMKQLLVDYPDASITRAFALQDEELPFGFEFLSRADFREINFGEASFDGPEVRIAGREAPRSGFTICRHCGQVPGRKGDTKHTMSCPARKRDVDREEDFIHALYLYRDFTSEAIRILLPETTLTGSERTRHSFIAALQLGLKRRFGGGVDHLRVTEYEEPIAESEHRKRSLVLYDSVPGGTGYLKELMRSREPLLEVLQMALEALRSCACHQDPEKDGCYRCLFAYRNAYDMPDTSRDRAIELLSQVLKRQDRFQEVKSLRNLPVNALFDSELEARFISALREASTPARPIRVKPQVVGRRAGYLLEIGMETPADAEDGGDPGSVRRTWYVEPQVQLGPEQGVRIPSRVDFLLRPARGQDEIAPVAVFLDGWAYHHDRIGKDLAQRAAISRSGRYRVWSLSWKDIERAISGDASHLTELLSPKGPAPRRQHYDALVGGFASSHGSDQLRELPGVNTFEWLLRHLADPQPDRWRVHATIQALLHIDQELSTLAGGRQEWEERIAAELPATLRDRLTDIEPKVLGAATLGGLPVRTYLAATATAVSTLESTELVFVCVLDDGDTVRARPDFQSVWNGVLRLKTLMQFIPGGLVLATSTFDADLHEELGLGTGWLDRSGSGVAAAETDTGWLEARELALPEALPLIEKLAEAGMPAPEVGYEILGGAGTVAGSAELAWPTSKLAVLHPTQEECTSAFTEAGWHVVPLATAAASPNELIDRLKQS